MSDNIRVQRSDGVLEIAFDRRERKNALTLAMYTRAAQLLEEATEDDAVRCVMFSGVGDDFTSGNDLMDFMQDPPTDESSPVFRFLLALRGCSCPVVAAVDGYAIGIGTTMLFHCDLAWAASTAQFRMPFVDLGLVPEAGSSVVLPAMVGHRKAAELLYFGEFFDGDRAAEMGIINAVVDDPVEVARQKARGLADKPPVALKRTKALLRRADDDVVEAAMRAEAEVFVERLQSEEFMRAVAEFQK